MSKADIDLDAILEDAVKSVAPAAPAAPVVASKPVSKGPVDADVKPFIAATALVTKDAREKWTKMIKDDIDAELPSSFHVSYALRSFDQPLPTKDGLNRCLQEIVKKAAIQSNLPEATVSRLVTLVNPVVDTEYGKQIQKAFGKQLLSDLKETILKDPNYEESSFPSLTKVIS